MGILLRAEMVCASVAFVEHLAITQEERHELLALRPAFDREFRQVILDHRRKNRRLSPEDRLRQLTSGDPLADAANQFVLDKIHAVLGTPARIRTFRRLYTQWCVQHYDVDQLITFHELKTVSPEAYVRYKKNAKQLEVDESEPRFIIPPVKRFMVASRLISEAEFERAFGVPFHSEVAGLPTQLGVMFLPSPSQRYFIEYSRILNSPPIQAELQLTQQQILDARRMNEHLSLSMNTAKAERLVRTLRNSADEERLAIRMEVWRNTCEDEVEELLNETQFKRYKQILFQHHVRRMQVYWALYHAGKRFRYHDHMGQSINVVQGEREYRAQAQRIINGQKLFADLIGDAKAKELCGDIILFGQTLAAVEPATDAPLRHRLERELLGKLAGRSHPRNPRRDQR